MKNETIKTYNPFDYINTHQETVLFLQECFEDKNPQVFIEALGHLIKKRGVSSIAEKTGLNRENLYRSFNGKSMPRWDTIHRILSALNIKITLNML